MEGQSPDPESHGSMTEASKDCPSRCPYYGKRFVLGDGPPEAEIIGIGEAPGQDEERTGKAFTGSAGTKLTKLMKAAGMKRTEICLRNCLGCRPPANKIKAPEAKQALSLCWPRLQGTLEGRKVIILFGGTALKRVLNLKDDEKISKHRGWRGYRYKGIPVVATYHPASFLHHPNKENERQMISDLKWAKRLAGFNPPKSNYLIMTEFRKTVKVLRELKKAKKLAFDIEDTNLSLDSEILGIGFSHRSGWGIYIPLRAPGFLKGEGLKMVWPENECRVIWKLLKDLLESDIPKAAHNFQYDIKKLRRHGIRVKKITIDTQILHHIVEDETQKTHKLENLAKRYLDLEGFKDDTQAMIEDGKAAEIPMEKLGARCARDCDATFRLAEEFVGVMKADEGALYKGKRYGFPYIYGKIVLPAAHVLAEMEYRGVLVDQPLLHDLCTEYRIKSHEMAKEIWDIAGEKFDLGSNSVEIPRILKKMGAEHLGVTGKGNVSVAEPVLAGMREEVPVAGNILDWRQLEKVRSTYLDGMVPKIGPDGRIHPSFHAAGPVTGRLSSSNPNGQNIPPAIRKIFIASKDHILVKADYSQMEIAIFGWYSGDSYIRDAFARGEDIHRAIAARLFKVEYGKVTPAQRSRAKEAVFGLLYGMGDETLAARTGMSVEGAAAFKAGFFRTFRDVEAWIKVTQERAEKEGILRSAFGRARRNPNPYTQAVNSLIQGTASDFVLRALRRVFGAGKDHGIFPILIVHDEILSECPITFVEEGKKIIRVNMEAPVEPINYPIKVDISIGERWGEMKEAA